MRSAECPNFEYTYVAQTLVIRVHVHLVSTKSPAKDGATKVYRTAEAADFRLVLRAREGSQFANIENR